MSAILRSTKPGAPSHIVRVGRGVMRIRAEAGVRYQLVDEATGKALVDAVAHKAGHDLVIQTADGETLRIEHFYDLTGSQSAAFDMPGASLVSITPMTDLMQAAGAATEPAAGAGAAGGGAAGGGAAAAGAAVGGAGLGTILPIALGAVALGGAAAAAGGGGGGGNAGPPPDTTPPAAPAGLDLDAADDTGSSNSDNVTSQTTGLTITGSAEANAKVEILNGTTVLATVTATATGTFTADITLPAGATSITARATDAAGNVGAVSSALAITVDTSAPATPTIDLDNADDTGTSNTDNVTTQTSGLTITGNAEAGSTVQIFDGATLLGSTTANGAGTYSLDVSLGVAAHSLTAKATDAAGNASAASAAMALKVVTPVSAPTAPMLLARDDTGSSNSDGITKGNPSPGQLTVFGQTSPNQLIHLYEGNALVGTTTATELGTYYRELYLAAGTHSFTAAAVAEDGSESVRSTIGQLITVDLTAPSVYSFGLDPADDNGYLNNDNVTNKANGLTVVGTADPGAVVRIAASSFKSSIGLGTAVADASGRFTLELANDFGNFSVNPTIAISASVTDAAGNSGGQGFFLTVDLQSPKTPLAPILIDDTGLADNITTQQTAVKFTLFDVVLSTVITSIYDNGALVKTINGYTTPTSLGVFDLNLTPGIHNISTVLTDAAGNSSARSAALKVTVATGEATGLALAAASDTGRSSSDGITSLNENLTFTGHAEAGSTITLTLHDLFRVGVADVVFGTGVADSSGNYSITGNFPPTSAGNARYEVVASGVNLLGEPVIPEEIVVTVDQVSGIASTPDLSAADDTGVNNDNITDNSTGLTFTGGTSADNLITIFVDGIDVGTIAPNNLGMYSFDLALASGTHQIATRFADPAGNVSALSAALAVTVNAGHDNLTGTSGNDILVGSSAANELFGGLGRDVMVGGAGADTFYLESARGQTLVLADVIADFQVGTDHMALDPALIGSGPALTFADLTIAQGTGTHLADTIVSVTAGGSILAVLENVTATTVTAASFTF